MDQDEGADRRAGSSADFIGGIARVVGARRAAPLTGYCTVQPLPGERKTVELMAARTAPYRIAAQHHSKLHVVGQADRSDVAVTQRVRARRPSLGDAAAFSNVFITAHDAMITAGSFKAGESVIKQAMMASELLRTFVGIRTAASANPTSFSSSA